MSCRASLWINNNKERKRELKGYKVVERLQIAGEYFLLLREILRLS